MSNYTTELRYICEDMAGLSESVGYSGVNAVIAKSRAKVFDFAYPIYDENYRSVLESKILKHYYTREIGAETVGQWKLWLDTKMNEIMPYYNQLYKSATIEFDPMLDVDISTTRKVIDNGGRTDNGTRGSGSSGSSTTRVDGDNWNYYSDTPQGGVNGLESMNYLTNATHDTEDTNTSNSFNTSTNDTTTNNSSFNNTQDYVESVKGKRNGLTYSKMLEEYRKTLLNIDMMIINDLKDLFFGLW